MFLDIIKGFLLGVFGIFLVMFVYLPLLTLIFLGPILMVPILSLIQLDTIPKVIMDCTVVIVIAYGTYRYIKKNTFPAHLMINGNYLPDDKDWGKKHLGKADAWLFLLAEQEFLCIEEKGKSYYMIKLKDIDYFFKSTKIFDIFTVVFIFLNLWFLQYKGYFYFIQHKNLNLQTKAFILFINDVIKRKDINLIKQIYLNDTKYGLKVLPYITYMGVEKKWFKHFDFLYDNYPSWLRLKYGTFLDFLKKL